MRLALALGLPLALCFSSILPAQQAVQGPEPGVFIYGRDEATGTFTRTYYPTQQEATAALTPRWTEGETVAAQLNQLCQANVNTRAVAEWLVFCEQWQYWQEWVKQEYELQASFDAGAEGTENVTFAAVPGTTLWWEQAAAPALGQPGAGPAPSGREGGGGEFGPGGAGAAEFEGAGMGFAPGGQQTQQPAEPAAITLQSWMAIPADQRQATVDSLHTVMTQLVQGLADEKYQVLTALLEDVDAREEARARRAAYIATRQRDITDLREIILNEEGATRVDVGGQTFLFSEQPLRRLPNNAVNITTPNLTPYDLFNSDGTVREGQ